MLSEDAAESTWSNIPDAEKAFFESQFKVFEKDGSGHINIDDLGPALQMCGFTPFQEDIARLRADLGDAEPARLVSFKEFSHCVIASLSNFRTLDNLKEAFRTFDPDHRGVLSQSDVRCILTMLGEKLTDEEMNNFMLEAASEMDSDGNIAYDALAMKFLPEFLK